METRDKLFTEEQYVKQLAKYTDRIERFNSIIEQSERNRKEPVNPDFYGRLFDCKVNYIVTMYSMGEKLECIKSNYISTINVLEAVLISFDKFVKHDLDECKLYHSFRSFSKEFVIDGQPSEVFQP